MGAAPSKPPPPPRVTRKLAGTTIQLQHLPPLITAAAREGILKAAQSRYLYLSPETERASVSPEAIQERLTSLITEAHSAGNFRDYLSLLIEKSLLGLCTKSGCPPWPLAELACLVNPFLNRERELVTIPVAENATGLEALRFAPAFRTADLEHVADEEKDLLVLLYYCCDIAQCADEAIDFVSRIATRSATPSILETRKEAFSETEIYVHWTSCYITTYLQSKPPGMRLSADPSSKLQVEVEANLHRLITICNMLLREHRLDQVCFLLQFLEITPSPEAQGFYRRRVNSLAKNLKNKKGGDRALQDWHVAVAEQIMRNLKRARDTGRSRYGWKGGVRIAIGDEYELHKAKRD